MFKKGFMYERLQQRRDEFLSHVSQEVKQIILNGDAVYPGHYADMRLNSYDQKVLQPFLTDQTLIEKIENAIKNRSVRTGELILPAHYDEYLAGDGIDELLMRFKKAVRRLT